MLWPCQWTMASLCVCLLDITIDLQSLRAMHPYNTPGVPGLGFFSMQPTNSSGPYFKTCDNLLFLDPVTTQPRLPCKYDNGSKRGGGLTKQERIECCMVSKSCERVIARCHCKEPGCMTNLWIEADTYQHRRSTVQTCACVKGVSQMWTHQCVIKIYWLRSNQKDRKLSTSTAP